MGFYKGIALALTELPRLADLRQEAMVRWAIKAQGFLLIFHMNLKSEGEKLPVYQIG